MQRDVLFPFGYGLSYTTFEYGNLRILSQEFTCDDSLEISLDITNTGTVFGKEVVQVYIRDIESELPRPPKELNAFTKVALDAGETKTVTLVLEPDAFAYYSPVFGQWLAHVACHVKYPIYEDLCLRQFLWHK